MESKDLSWNEVTTKRFNNPLLPRSIRGIIRLWKNDTFA